MSGVRAVCASSMHPMIERFIHKIGKSIIHYRTNLYFQQQTVTNNGTNQIVNSDPFELLHVRFGDWRK